MTRVIPDPM